MGNLEIIEYEERYHEDLKRLSLEWLMKYDLLEPEDEKILNFPKEAALDRGGFIFFARYNGEIVGTASLIKSGSDTFELAKLAVTEKYQGLSIGKRLIEKCLYTAKKEQVAKVILYTNHKLTTAIHLYRKYSFKEVEDFNSKYLESDMKMELLL